jgi:hypothetical protein
MKLWRRRKGILSIHDTIPKSRKLSDLEEQIIVQYILDLDSRGFPPRHRSVEEMANRLLTNRDASPVVKRWAINLVKRQPDLKTRFQRRHDYQRARCEDPTTFAIGSGSYRTQSRSMVSNQMISITLMRPAL